MVHHLMTVELKKLDGQLDKLEYDRMRCWIATWLPAGGVNEGGCHRCRMSRTFGEGEDDG
jgi:hypothetical protein